MAPDEYSASASSHRTGVDRLLAVDGPWIGAVALARHLLVAWSDAFQLPRCAVLWQDPDSGLIRCEVHDAGGTRSDSPQPELSPPLTAEELESLCQGEFRPLPSRWGVSDLAWTPLISDRTALPLAWGLLPENAWQRIPAAWKETSARLLSWAVEFEHRLAAQKLSALAEYAAGAGHEINNPLGSIIGRASQLLKGETDPERRRNLETIGAQAYRIRDMIGDTMTFARPPAPVLQDVELVGLIRQVLCKHQAAIDAKRIHVEEEAPHPVLACADPVQVSIVVSELLRNAIQAAPAQGRIRWTCSQRQAGSMRQASLEIADNGPGMTPEQAEHCFDPFYSGRQAGRGLGFGLSKCWRIVQQNRGTIWFTSHPEETCFHVLLPAGTGED